MIDRMFTAATVLAIALQTAAVLVFFGVLALVILESFQFIQGPY